MIFTIATLLWRSGPEAPDPVYQGKRLSTYVKQFPATYTAGDGGYTSFPVNAPNPSQVSQSEYAAWRKSYEAEIKEAEEAVRAMGQECFPLLLEYVSARESWLDKALEKLPGSIQSRFRRAGYRVKPNRTYARRWQAVTALRRLDSFGCDMKPIVPKLVVLGRNADSDIRMAARLLLGQIDSGKLAELESEDDSPEEDNEIAR